MAQMRKLQLGGLLGAPPINENPQKPLMLIIGNTEYNMDKYVRDLEKNFEGWLESENFSEKQKNEQRRLFPIFILKLRSGVITLTEGGGWRDASFETYNDKDINKDKWGRLAGFAAEGAVNLTAYKEEPTLSSREVPEYDPSTGLSALKNLLFGLSKSAFVDLDDWADDTKTKKGLTNRSALIYKGLKAFKANPEKYYKFKYQEDKDDIISKVDYILENVIGDPSTGKGDGIISPNELFYISNLGFGDITDYFATDFTQPTDYSNRDGSSYGGNVSGNYGNGLYGSTASAESIASWLSSKPKYKVKKTAGILDFNLNNLYTMNPNTVIRLRSAIHSMDNKAISRSIYKYFYNRKKGGLKLEGLLELFQNDGYLLGEANKNPNQVTRLMLEEMVANNSSNLENIGGNKYIISGTLSKNNTILMWDNINKKISEVSAYYSPKFRNRVLTKFAEETGIYNIPSDLDWYSPFYKQGGVIKAQKGTNIWRIKNNYYNFADDVTGENGQKLFWNPSLNKWTTMTQVGIDAGLSGTTKDILDLTFNWNNFNTFKNLAIAEGKNYFTFDTNSGTFKALDSNIDANGKTLSNVWNLNDIVNSSPEEGSVGYRIDKSKKDYTFDNAFAGDDPYTGDFNDQSAFNKWVTETNMLNSGWKGIYYSKADNKWYRTKNTPTTGNLLTASIVDAIKLDKRKNPLDNLRLGPSNFDKFILFFGPASADISMDIFTRQRNNIGAERMNNAMNRNYKSRLLEVAEPLTYNFNAATSGKGIDIESRADDAADNYTDASLGTAVRRQGTLDRIAYDTLVGTALSLDLLSQVQRKIANLNKQNLLAALRADDNLAEDNRVTLAQATVLTENDKVNTENSNKVAAKYIGQLGDYLTLVVNRKQETADTANTLAAQAWFSDAVASAKTEWEKINGKDDMKWSLSPEYLRLKREFNNMVALGNDYVPFSRTNRRWPYYRNGGVLSLKTQALLNKIIK